MEFKGLPNCIKSSTIAQEREVTRRQELVELYSHWKDKTPWLVNEVITATRGSTIDDMSILINVLCDNKDIINSIVVEER